MENTNWIPVSSGKLPQDKEVVQITYLGYYDRRPYCDGFAYRKSGIWHWVFDGEQIIVPVTAWKYNCIPYQG